MTPAQLWRSTPTEVQSLLTGYEWRLDREMERTAWQTAYLMNIHLARKDHVTIDELLGKHAEQSQTDKEAQFAQLWERHERRQRGEA